jgi:BMFP domain-containing protein YqiC
MTPREEFHAAVGILEETMTRLALLLQCFRRLEETLVFEEKADFNFMTGTLPADKVKR